MGGGGRGGSSQLTVRPQLQTSSHLLAVFRGRPILNPMRLRRKEGGKAEGAVKAATAKAKAKLMPPPCILATLGLFPAKTGSEGLQRWLMSREESTNENTECSSNTFVMKKHFTKILRSAVSQFAPYT